MTGRSPLFARIPGASPRFLWAASLAASVGLAAYAPFAYGDAPERYRIVRGDTLSKLSQRFFGDANAWNKLYDANRDTISNPNLIYPDKWIVFTPGTSGALPKVAVAGAPFADHPDRIETARARPRSTEWRDLPKQSWESVPTSLPPTVDKSGFDQSNKVSFGKARGFALPILAASDRLASFGQIIGARTGAEYLTLGDTVYIRADEDVQVGETYAITQEPTVLKSRRSDRMGYSYHILGQVKIIGVRDELFIGTITAGQDFIFRGAELISNPPRVPELKPLASENATEGVIMLDHAYSTYATAQHKLIFIDRGAADGVKPGMYFRAYEHYDLSNEKRITSSDFIIDADAMVVQVSERFCVALITSSANPITENSTAVLLTDVSDLDKHREFRGVTPGDKSKDQGNDELDELDKLDGGTGMGKDEQKELEQLERWKGNPAGQPTPGSSGEPAANPTEGAPPPPPGEEVPPPPAEAGKPEEALPPPPLSDSLPTPAATVPSGPTDAPAVAPESGAPPVPTATATMQPADISAAPPAPTSAPTSAPRARTRSAPPAPSEPTPPPPPAPAPDNGSSQESKDLDRLLNQ